VPTDITTIVNKLQVFVDLSNGLTLLHDFTINAFDPHPISNWNTLTQFTFSYELNKLGFSYLNYNSAAAVQQLQG